MAMASDSEDVEAPMIQSARNHRDKGLFSRCFERCLGTPTQKLVSEWVEKDFSRESSFDGTVVDEVWEEYAGRSNTISTNALASFVVDCTEALVIKHAQQVLAAVLQTQVEAPEDCAKGMQEAFSGAEGIPVSKGMFKRGLASALLGLLPVRGGTGVGGAHEPLVTPINKKELAIVTVNDPVRVNHPMVAKTGSLTRQTTNGSIAKRRAEQSYAANEDDLIANEAQTEKKKPLESFNSMLGPMKLRAKALPVDPTNAEPIYTKRLPGVSMTKLREVLEADPWVVTKALESSVGAMDTKPSKWSDGLASKKSKIRGLSFKMPKPDDIPAAVAKLQSVPDILDVSTVFRMTGSDKEVILVEQTSVPDVPFGGNFEVLATHCFRPYGANDGVNYYKWAVCVWVKDLSWTMKWIKPIIEKESRTKAAAAGDDFAKEILKACE